MFLWEYIKNPRRVGAIAPSSKRLAAKMMEPVDFGSAAVIVEYGPGTGVFTREIVKRKKPETKLVLIEQNENFFREIRDAFGNVRNVYVCHGSAEDADLILGNLLGNYHADVIISGLPFTSLPTRVSSRIFDSTLKVIGDSGRFITFQYSRIREKMFAGSFHIERRLHEFKNIPPAYVYVMTKGVTKNEE